MPPISNDSQRDNPNINDSLINADLLKKLIVEPVVDKVRAELQLQIEPLVIVQKQQQELLVLHTAGIAKLDKNQSRALVGFSGIAVLITGLCSAFWTYVSNKWFPKL